MKGGTEPPSSSSGKRRTEGGVWFSGFSRPSPASQPPPERERDGPRESGRPAVSHRRAWCDPGTASDTTTEKGREMRAVEGEQRKPATARVLRGGQGGNDSTARRPLAAGEEEEVGELSGINRFRRLGFETQMRHHQHRGRRCVMVVPATTRTARTAAEPH